MLLHGGDGWGISPERDEALWRGLIAAQKAGSGGLSSGCEIPLWVDDSDD